MQLRHSFWLSGLCLYIYRVAEYQLQIFNLYLSILLQYFRGKLWTTYKLLSCFHYMLSYHRIISFSVVFKAVSVHVFFRICYLELKSCIVTNLRDLTKYFSFFLLRILLILFKLWNIFSLHILQMRFCFKYCIVAMTTTILRSSLCIKMAD